MTSPKAQGDYWQHRCATCANERGGMLGFVKRMANPGALPDIGDLDFPALCGGRVGVVIQCKNQRQLRLADWINGLNDQRGNYLARFPVGETVGAVLVPRRPHGDGGKPGRALPVERGYAITEIQQFYRMLELIKEGPK